MIQINWLPNYSLASRQTGDFVSMKIYGRPGRFKDFTALAVTEGQELLGALIFYDWDMDAGVIQVSGAANDPRWLNRRTLYDMHSFVFDQLGCQCLAMRVDPDDKRLHRILTAGHYERHIIPRLRGRNKDEALYLLFDEHWEESKFWRNIRRKADHG